MAGALSKSNGCADSLIGAQLSRGTGKLESLVINDSWQADGSATLFFSQDIHALSAGCRKPHGSLLITWIRD
jgi:hypothetical protein